MTTHKRLTPEDVDRWCCEVMPFPLPEHMTPTGGAPLADLPLEVLLEAPPHLIAHVQRTAAQGGMQVVSPRQTPFSSLMLRTRGGERQLGDHVVGSVADPTMEWPTIDDADFSDLLPDEPLPSPELNKATRTKTRTEPITKAGKLLSDPILACLVKGRAVIDILRREDVAGGAEVMTELLAKAWGIGVEELDDLDAFTLGVQGPLLRHAIRADEVFPTCYAPVHIKRCVSTGVSEVTRDLLPADSAMDWRRMRVHCEAVFVMSCAVEGLPIKRMRCYPPPGDPSAKTDRPGVMVFQPAPASAWTFAPSTFSIYPQTTLGYARSSQIPREVLDALGRYTRVVRPVSYALATGHRAAAKRTLATRIEMPLGETISEAYRFVARSLMVGSARGRTAAATVRNLIFQAIESAPLPVRMRIARYLSIAPEECRVHLQTDKVPDLVVDKIANKFVEVGELIRLHVVAEAARRGATAEEWWGDILAQSPDNYKMMSEGTRGWARIGMWLIFRAPTERWTKLVKAVKYSALREAATRSVGAMALPAEKGSKERLVAAARIAARNITKAYAAYYIGVSDVGLAVADVLDTQNKGRSAETLREASYLWTLRARCMRGTNVNPIARDDPTPSTLQYRVYTDPVDLLLTPTPYRGFQAYVKHVMAAPVMPSNIKRHFGQFEEHKVSKAFLTLDTPILPAKKTIVTTYLVNPRELGTKMEQAWSELTSDIREVAKIFGGHASIPALPDPVPDTYVQAEVPICIDALPKVEYRKDYYTLLGELDMDEVDWMEEMMERLPPMEAEEIMTMTFRDYDHLRETMLASEKEFVSKVRRTEDFVR